LVLAEMVLGRTGFAPGLVSCPLRHGCGRLITH
jgi:hypothetical protein